MYIIRRTHTIIDVLIFGFVNRAGPPLVFDEMYCIFIINYMYTRTYISPVVLFNAVE